jgi:iron complex transport system ATP-binding protein
MVLNVCALQLSHGGQSPLLRDASFAIERGEVLCILGPNGAGKTTLLRALLGAHRPDAGSIHIAGNDVLRLTARALARRVAYVPQATATPVPLSVADIVLMGRTPHLSPFATPSALDAKLALEALDRMGIADLHDRRFTEISGGERQLTLIARAIAQQAELLVLDEPSASLDFGNQIRILRIIGRLAADGYAIVMATHFPDHALLMRSQVAVLHGGRLAAEGRAASILTGALLSAVYDMPIQLVALPQGPGNQDITICVPVFDRHETQGL